MSHNDIDVRCARPDELHLDKLHVNVFSPATVTGGGVLSTESRQRFSQQHFS